MRLQTYYLVNIQLDKKNQFKTPQDLMPFDWDDDIKTHKKVHIPTKEEWKDINEFFKASLK